MCKVAHTKEGSAHCILLDLFIDIESCMYSFASLLLLLLLPLLFATLNEGFAPAIVCDFVSLQRCLSIPSLSSSFSFNLSGVRLISSFSPSF